MAKIFIFTTLLAGALWAAMIASGPITRALILGVVVLAPAALRAVLNWRRRNGL